MHLLQPVVVAASLASPPAIEPSSDFRPLVDGFRWGPGSGLAYVFEGEPVGSWFEASLPGREALFMRDVAHQSIGGAALGVGPRTRTSWMVDVSTPSDWIRAKATSRSW